MNVLCACVTDAFLHLIPHAMNPHSHAVVAPVVPAPSSSWLPHVHAADFGAPASMHAPHDDHHHAEPAHLHAEVGHKHGAGHSHSHAHSHTHEDHATDAAHTHKEQGHAHDHAHEHGHVEEPRTAPGMHTQTLRGAAAKPTTAGTKELGGAAGHSHSHSHSPSDEPERGRAAGHSHAHSHSTEPEHGAASGHSHSHSDERGAAHGHSHAHDDDDHHDHDHSASTNVGLLILAGMFAFFTIEKLARAHSGGGGHGHSHGGHSHGHSHSNSGDRNAAKPLPTATAFAFDDANEKQDASSGLRSRKPAASSGKPAAASKPAAPAAPAVTAEQRITGLLNLIGDFSHNFTDGMALSASYLAGGHVGLSTTLAVLIHEVPHEIGDFAILLQSGFTVKAALQAQLLTAVGALAGCCFGYWSGATGDSTQTSWILPFTAGGFIYVALVNVMPTLLPHQSLRQTLAEMTAMMLGVSLMVAIAAFE
jgi:zinc transporter 7